MQDLPALHFKHIQSIKLENYFISSATCTAALQQSVAWS
jgi:hypothetical protein